MPLIVMREMDQLFTRARCLSIVGLASILAMGPTLVRDASAQTGWTRIGPDGGRVSAIAIDPVAPSIVYAGTVGGGVFRSTDSGVTWTAINSGLSHPVQRLPVDVAALAIHPVTPSVLYAGTQGGAGIYRSTDSGQTWVAVNTGLPPTAAESLALNPLDPATIYLASWGSGVFRSDDGGNTWSATGLSGQFVESLALDPVDPSIVYAGTLNGVFRSTDGGGTWSTVNVGLPATSPWVHAVVVDPASPTTLYAALGTGVFRSTDGGTHWTPTALTVPSFELAVDPQTPTTVLAGTRAGMFRSTDAGTTWAAINSGLQGFAAPDAPYVSAVAIDPSTPSTAYVGLYDGGLGAFRTTDSGASWVKSSTGLRAAGVPAILIDPASPATLYVATQGDGIHRSLDGGTSWSPINTGLGSNITALTVNAAVPPTFYAGSERGYVYRRSSPSDTWVRLSAGLPLRTVTALVASPVNAGVVYAGTVDRGVYRSTNQGTSWTLAGLANQQIRTLAIDPQTPSTLYAATYSELFRSVDSGSTWATVGQGLPGGAKTLAIDPTVPSTLYAATGFGIYRSLDSGATWTRSSNGLSEPVESLAIDPADPRVLYAVAARGFAISTNLGTNWTTLSTLGDVSPVTMAVPRHPPDRLYVGTFGSSVVAVDADWDDGDGLPKAWEIQFGLNPHVGTDGDGPDGDPDGDGRTNAEELASGGHPRGIFTRYLAEGATGEFFSTRLALANPEPVARSVLLRFLRSNGGVVTHAETIRPLTRISLDVATIDAALAAEEFSVTIEADGPVSVDRTMSWDSSAYGSHAETAVEAPGETWYLAEGSTVGRFDLFYLLQNPGSVPADVRITFLRPSGASLVRTYRVEATSRFTLWVDQIAELESTDVSAVIDVTAGPPIIVERAMYLSGARLFEAGHESAGVRAPATAWFLAEGATGPFFDEFILLANPTALEAQVRATYLLPDGSTVVKHYTVPPTSRRTVWVDFEDVRLADTAVSVRVDSTNGVAIIVERAMWWPGPTAATWTEAHNSPGSTRTATRWVLAEGEVAGATAGASGAVDTFILVANTSPASGTVRVTLLFENAPVTVREFVVTGSSRFNIWVRAEFPLAVGRRFGAVVEGVGESAPDLVVERAMYRNADGIVWSSGTNALAMPMN